MANLFVPNFGGVQPYGFTGQYAADMGTYFDLTQFLGTGPGNRDWIRSANRVVGDVHQFYAGWAKLGLTAPASGASRFVRLRLRVGAGFNSTGNGDLWSDKWIMIGDQGSANEGDRIIAQLASRIGTTDCQLRVTRNIGGVPSEGAGDVNLPLGSWLSIQYEVRFGSSGYIKIWVNTDAYSTPTSQSSTFAISPAGLDSVELGFYHNASTAAGGNVVLDYAQFQYADTFDANWHATLGTPGADPPPPDPVPPDPDPSDPDPAPDPVPPPEDPAYNPSPHQSVIGATVRFAVGTLVVDLPTFQWGYREGTMYLERDLGTTPAGVRYRAKTETDTRSLTVRFATSDTALSRLRELSVYAARTASRVQFFPDLTDTTTYRWIDWPATLDVRFVVEGRLNIELPLVEQVS